MCEYIPRRRQTPPALTKPRDSMRNLGEWQEDWQLSCGVIPTPVERGGKINRTRIWVPHPGGLRFDLRLTAASPSRTGLEAQAAESGELLEISAALQGNIYAG